MTLAMVPDVAADLYEVDLRCPETAGKLLGKIHRAGRQPSFVQPDNLIELACDSCKLARRRAGRPVIRVLHRYSILGELVETLVVE
jgi:hypothetical protein